jgi:hypothetical protein
MGANVDSLGGKAGGRRAGVVPAGLQAVGDKYDVSGLGGGRDLVARYGKDVGRRRHPRGISRRRRLSSMAVGVCPICAITSISLQSPRLLWPKAMTESGAVPSRPAH